MKRLKIKSVMKTVVVAKGCGRNWDNLCGKKE